MLIYEPIYGSTNSNRFPDYKRIDFRITYFNMIYKKYSFVCYMEGINIFNFKNIFGYSYSYDYSLKKEIASYFGKRMLIFGFMLQF